MAFIIGWFQYRTICCRFIEIHSTICKLTYIFTYRHISKIRLSMKGLYIRILLLLTKYIHCSVQRYILSAYIHTYLETHVNTMHLSLESQYMRVHFPFSIHKLFALQLRAYSYCPQCTVSYLDLAVPWTLLRKGNALLLPEIEHGDMRTSKRFPICCGNACTSSFVNDVIIWKLRGDSEEWYNTAYLVESQPKFWFDVSPLTTEPSELSKIPQYSRWPHIDSRCGLPSVGFRGLPHLAEESTDMLPLLIDWAE
jgi:hypothetical protein